MTLTPGSRIASFEIVRPLGAGGMGEVYEARDTRLGRRVAIKVLPEVFAAEPDRLVRFEREAQAVAALSHPNILALHEFGRDGALVYAVMELLEGATLREALAGGALPPRTAINYAAQIAHGLAAAHESGIAHRDLKPENIFVTRDDRVKILDFGLAKGLSTAPGDATFADTRATAAGTVLGTMGYMAPEQVRGRDTDHRADLFAFGAVLYEMLTGRRAFQGETAADTISAILNTDPPELESAAGGVPPALERIVRRCLEKKPEMRFQSARDLAFALETVSSPSGTSVVMPAAAARRPRMPLVATAAILVIAALALVAWIVLGRAAPPPAFEQFTQVTDAAGEEWSPAISPDGSTVAYTTRARGTWDVFVQRVGGRNPTPVAADPRRHEGSPAFSPDGRLIAFHEEDDDGGIFVARATGEAARRVTDFGFHPAWSPDGRQLALTTEMITDVASRQGNSALWRVSLEGGAPQLVEGTGDAAQASWSPSGTRLAYWSNTGGQRDIYTIPVTGGQRTPVTQDGALDSGPVWTPDGQSLLFFSNRGDRWEIWRIARDGGRLQKVAGLSDDEVVIPLLSARQDRLAVSSNVRGMFIKDARDPSAPLRPIENARLGNETLNGTAWSPDDTKIVGPLVQASGNPAGVGVYDFTTRSTRKVSSDATFTPVWLADSRRIVYFTLDGQLVLLDTSSLERRVVTVQLPLQPTSEAMAISRDNRTIVYGGRRAESDIWVVDRLTATARR